jgi:hypothetical protein
MTNQDRIEALLRQHPGLTDREIRERTAITPHQQVNQITNRLQRLGRIRRVQEGGVYRNYPVGAPAAGMSGSARPPVMTPSRASNDRREDTAWRVDALTDASVLLVIPCSSGKRTGGSTSAGGPSVVDHLPAALGDELVAARRAMAARADVRADALLPAWQRYDGNLYQAAGDALRRFMDAGVPLAIISGGYGVVLADESVGWYEAMFHPADWPHRVVPRCLAALTAAFEVRRVVALAGASTKYAAVIRRVAWPVPAVLLSPAAGGGGAMRRTPRVIGEAVRTLASAYLDAGWRSSEGVGLRREQLA